MRRPPCGMFSFSCSRMPLTFWAAASVILIMESALPPYPDDRTGKAPDLQRLIIACLAEAMQASKVADTSADPVARLARSGLRGRGGGWFPAARKWHAVRVE